MSPPVDRHDLLAYAAAAFSFCAGPVGYVFHKLLVAGTSPVAIVVVQAGIGAVVLWAVLGLFFAPPPLRWTQWIKPTLLGCVHPGAFMIALSASGRLLDSLTFVLMMALVPFLVALLGRMLLGEELTRLTVVAFGLCLAGLVVVATGQAVTGETTASGVVLCASSLFVAAGGQVAGRLMLLNDPMPWYVVAPCQLTGAAACAAACALVLGVPVTAGHVFDNIWIYAYLALIMSAATYLLYNFALSRLPVVHMGLIAASGPAAGAVAAAAIFGTQLGLRSILGILLIVWGTALPGLWGLVRRLSR